MTTRSDAALSTLLLTSRIVDVEAPALSPKEYRELVRQVSSPDKLLGRTSAEIATSSTWTCSERSGSRRA